MELNREKREVIHNLAMSVIKTTNIKSDKISKVLGNGIGTVLKKRSRKEGQAFNLKDLNNLLNFIEYHASDIMMKRVEIKEVLGEIKINEKTLE